MDANSSSARIVQAYQNVFLNSEDGRIILDDLMGRFGYTTQSTLDPKSNLLTAFNEGQRSVVSIYLCRMIAGHTVPYEEQTHAAM